MTPEPPLEYMLEQPAGPPAGRDELAAIVARSSRRRTRIAAAGMAVTLLVGAVGGWAIANRTRSDKRVVASAASPSSPTTGAPQVTGGSAIAYGSAGPGGPDMKRTFVRTTADGVTLRGFELSPPKLPPGVPNGCVVGFPLFNTELSTAGMSGQFGAGFDTSGAFDGSVAVLGQAEQAPVWVAIAHSGAGISLVRVHFSDGSTDEMAPVNGWVALAHGAPAQPATGNPNTTATLEGLNQQGKVVATVQLDQTGSKFHPKPGSAAGPVPAQPAVRGAPGCAPPGPIACPPAPNANCQPALPACPPAPAVKCPAATTGGGATTGGAPGASGSGTGSIQPQSTISPPAT